MDRYFDKTDINFFKTILGVAAVMSTIIWYVV